MHNSPMRKHDILPLEDYATLSAVERLACFCDHSLAVIGTPDTLYRNEILATRRALNKDDMDWDFVSPPADQALFDYTAQNFRDSYFTWLELVAHHEENPLFFDARNIEEKLWHTTDEHLYHNVTTAFFQNAAYLLELNLHAIDLVTEHYDLANSHADQVINKQFYYWRLNDLPTYTNHDGQPASQHFSKENQAIADTLVRTPLLAEALHIRSVVPGFYQP